METVRFRKLLVKRVEFENEILAIIGQLDSASSRIVAEISTAFGGMVEDLKGIEQLEGCLGGDDDDAVEPKETASSKLRVVK